MKNNYIVIGDSITYGIGDFESGGWATMFKQYIVNKDDSKVCNNYVHIAAFPGATSTDILNKIDNIENLQIQLCFLLALMILKNLMVILKIVLNNIE